MNMDVNKVEKQEETKKSGSKKVLYLSLAVIAVLVVVAAVLAGMGDSSGSNGDDPNKVGGQILEIEERGDVVVVSTAYGEIVYPFAFSDMLEVVSFDDRLEFYGKLESGDYLLYTLWFDKEQGTPVGTVQDGQGNERTVYMEICQRPETLNASDTNAFFAAQETVNEVIESLLG